MSPRQAYEYRMISLWKIYNTVNHTGNLLDKSKLNQWTNTFPQPMEYENYERENTGLTIEINTHKIQWDFLI